MNRRAGTLLALAAIVTLALTAAVGWAGLRAGAQMSASDVRAPAGLDRVVAIDDAADGVRRAEALGLLAVQGDPAQRGALEPGIREADRDVAGRLRALVQTAGDATQLALLGTVGRTWSAWTAERDRLLAAPVPAGAANAAHLSDVAQGIVEDLATVRSQDVALAGLQAHQANASAAAARRLAAWILAAALVIEAGLAVVVSRLVLSSSRAAPRRPSGRSGTREEERLPVG